MKANNILETIGNTPHVRINSLFPTGYDVWMKVERGNPGGSIKDRIALAMIEDAEQRGILNKDSVIIEPTSGNTGIGLAMVCAVKKYKLILVMPESFSVERRRIMAAYGAQFELTPREKGMAGALEKTREMVAAIPNSWSPMQFDNTANVAIHQKTTALEIIKDFPEGFDYMVSGIGTGGHFTGVVSILKNHFPQMKAFAVEPELSPLLSGGKAGPHPLQGIGANFVPSILQKKLIDGIVLISKDEAYEYARKAASEEGIFVGVSSGASLAAVAKKIAENQPGKKILTFSYDTGERYLTLPDLFL